MVVPMDVLVSEADGLLAGVFLPVLGVHGLDLHMAEEPSAVAFVCAQCFSAVGGGLLDSLSGRSRHGEVFEGAA